MNIPYHFEYLKDNKLTCLPTGDAILLQSKLSDICTYKELKKLLINLKEWLKP